jgi:xylose isomerase
MRFAIEPKPNEPRGDIFLPTVGHALHFISTLDRPDLVGVNPEVAHETMAGLSFHYAVGQALWVGKLFHIDLNAQRIGRYDQDFRFGAEDLKEAFLLVRLLETAGYAGPRHFDAHAYRNEDADGVWDFARGCMRTYLALAERARHFDALPEAAEALAAASAPELAESSASGLQEADALKREADALDELARRGYANEALDQLVVDVLLGAR